MLRAAESETVHPSQADIRVFVYTLNEDGVTEEQTESEEDVTACQQWVLPAAEYHGLWERYA